MSYSRLHSLVFGMVLILSLLVPNCPLKAMEEITHTLPTEVDFERHAPPFFRIELSNGKIIYILGALHSIPINIALSVPTLKELERISTTEKPILMTEHSASNAVNLEHMGGAKIEMGESWMNESKHKGLIPKEGFQQLFKIVKDKIFINMEHKSDLDISSLLTLDPWLAAPILQMHIGVLYKKKFGGFEHDLESSMRWNPHWTDIRFLETHETLLEIAQHNKVQDYDENLKWINSSLRLFLIISTYDENPLAKEAIKNERIRDIKYFTWNHINDPERYETSIARNKAWVIKMHQELKGSGKVFLLVMGTAHLSGQENFFSLLLKSFGSEPIVFTRFSNTEGWVKF